MPLDLWKLSPEELDGYPWVVLRVATSGLPGGVNYDQQFDSSRACPTCGAGARPTPALVANLNKMGRKRLDRTAHEGQFVISADFAEALRSSVLTGFSISSVQHFSTRHDDARFFWLRIVSEWPRMHPRRILTIEDPCPACQRGGHFDSYKCATEFWYDHAPPSASDFNLTWEYFGPWRPHRFSSRTVPVGGCQMPILSRRARIFLQQHKIKHVSFDPVFFESTVA